MKDKNQYLEKFYRRQTFTGTVTEVRKFKRFIVRFDDDSANKPIFSKYVDNKINELRHDDASMVCTGEVAFELYPGMRLSMDVMGVDKHPTYKDTFVICDHSCRPVCDTMHSSITYLTNAYMCDTEREGDTIRSADKLATTAEIKELFNAFSNGLFGDGSKIDLLDEIRRSAISDLRQYVVHAAELKAYVIRNDLVSALAGLHPLLAEDNKLRDEVIDMLGKDAYDLVSADPYVIATDVNTQSIDKADLIATNLFDLDRYDGRRILGICAWAVAHTCENMRGMFLALDDPATLELIFAKINTQLINGYMHPDKQNQPYAQWLPDVAMLEACVTSSSRLLLLNYGPSPSSCRKVVYRKRDYDNEERVSDIVAEMAVKTHKGDAYEKKIVDTIDLFDQWIGSREGKHPLDRYQREAVLKAFTNKLSVVTGGAGTGKSSVIDAILYVGDHLNRMKPYILTPTHKAKRRVYECLKGSTSVDVVRNNVRTIASWLSEYRVTGKPDDFSDEFDIMIVDETSMLSLEDSRTLLESIMNRKHIVFIGDPKQLPSIKPGSFLKDLCDSCVAVTHLNINHRSHGREIVDNANMIAAGNYQVTSTEGVFDIRNGYATDCVTDYAAYVRKRLADMGMSVVDPEKIGDLFKDIVVVTVYNADVDYINRLIRDDINPVTGEIDVNSFGVAYTDYGTKITDDFRIGDRVVCTSNELEYGNDAVKNGHTAVIIRATPMYDPDEKEASILVTIKDEVTEEEIIKREWAVKTKHSYMLKDFARSFRLGYCLTVHKAQGSEYEKVIFYSPSFERAFPPKKASDIGRDFTIMNRELIYTAMTRAIDHMTIYCGDKNLFETAVTRTAAVRNSFLPWKISKKMSLRLIEQNKERLM